MSLQLFTVTHQGSLWVDTDPTLARIRKVMKEALTHGYAVEIVLREKQARDVRA